MTITAVILDTTSLGLVTQRAGRSFEADASRTWMQNLLASGIHVYVPDIADYEVRRELLRAKKFASILRLDQLRMMARYLSVTTEIMKEAAALWANARNMGVPTADLQALDGDVIVCAQALSLNLPASTFVIATSNVKHISRFTPASEWAAIKV